MEETARAKRHSRRSLASREQEILGFLARGCTNQEIADNLHINPQTVKNHVWDILLKVGAHNRTELAVYAIRRELVGASPCTGPRPGRPCVGSLVLHAAPSGAHCGRSGAGCVSCGLLFCGPWTSPPRVAESGLLAVRGETVGDVIR